MQMNEDDYDETYDDGDDKYIDQVKLWCYCSMAVPLMQNGTIAVCRSPNVKWHYCSMTVLQFKNCTIAVW